MKYMLAMAAAGALAISATAASAESLADTVNARASSEASIGMHLALGGKAHETAKPVYGASLELRRGGETAAQALTTPAAKIAELNFSGGQVTQARVGAMSFVTQNADGTGTRLGFDMGSSGNWIIAGLVIGGAAFIVTDDSQNKYDWHKNINHERLFNPQ